MHDSSFQPYCSLSTLCERMASFLIFSPAVLLGNQRGRVGCDSFNSLLGNATLLHGADKSLRAAAIRLVGNAAMGRFAAQIFIN
jgi:hypothetical protein